MTSFVPVFVFPVKAEPGDLADKSVCELILPSAPLKRSAYTPVYDLVSYSLSNTVPFCCCCICGFIVVPVPSFLPSSSNRLKLLKVSVAGVCRY